MTSLKTSGGNEQSCLKRGVHVAPEVCSNAGRAPRADSSGRNIMFGGIFPDLNDQCKRDLLN